MFTEQEKQHIVDDFEYYNVRKEKDFENDPGCVLPTDPFAEQMLSSTQNADLKNVSSRSIILAPFNSTKSNVESQSSEIQRMLCPKNIIKFAAKVKEIERQYELNNNAELDNGVYHQDEEEDKQEQAHKSREGNLESSFNAQQL